MSKKREKNTDGVTIRQSTEPVVVDGRHRVVIDAVRPVVDGGRFAIKRVEGERVVVEADIFADGHDELSALLLYRERDLILIQKGMMIGTGCGNCGNPLVDTMDDDEHLGAVDLFCLLEDNIFNTAGDRQNIRGVQVREGMIIST